MAASTQSHGLRISSIGRGIGDDITIFVLAATGLGVVLSLIGKQIADDVIEKHSHAIIAGVIASVGTLIIFVLMMVTMSVIAA